MTSEPPRVAVIVPCFRDGELAAGAVASIDEHEPVEVVVVDDASDDPETERALERVAAGGTRVARHARNEGLSAARCTGLRETSAPYVFPLDADDLAVPGVLAAMADRLDADPEAAVCYGDYAEFGSAERLRAVPARIDPYRLAYTNEYPVSALFRRSVLEEVSGWTKLDAYEDWDLWMKLAERGARGIHFGFGIVTYRRRLHRERMLARARTFHPELYAELRRMHPALFAAIAEHRRRSPLNPTRKRLYPIVYGRRRRYRWEEPVKRLLERLGVWTLER